MYKDLLKLKSGTDIRGVALEGEPNQPVQLTDKTVYAIARAFAKWVSEKYGKTDLTVAVGRDCRLSGERIEGQVVSALCDSGFSVIRCGLCTTPAMFMTTVLKNCDAAISITASHHPYNRNGLKFFVREGGLEGADISDILNITLSGDTISGDGKVTDCAFLDEYAAYLRGLICKGLGAAETDKPLSGLKFAVDAGNGAGGFYAEKVLFSGDTLFANSIGRTDFPGGSFEVIADSIRTRLYTLPEATVVYPGHGEFTTIGEEKRGNMYVR